MRLARPSARRWAVVAAPAVAAALLAGCSGDPAPTAGPAAGSSASPSASAPVASQVVRAASSTTQEAGSSKLELTTEVTAGGQDVTIRGAGAFDYAAGTGTLSLELPAAAGGGAVEQRVFPDKVYLSLPQEPGVFYELDASDLAGTPFSGSSDPTASFAALDTVADDVREVGTETLRGEQVTHYTGTYDASAVSAQLQGGPAGQALEGVDLSSVPFDLYLDEQGRLRKLEQTLEVPASPQTGGSPVRTRTVVELFDFGTPVEVTAPPADAVKDGGALLEAFRGGTAS